LAKQYKSIGMKFKYLYILIGAFVVMAAASCKKDLTKANTNPDQITGSEYDPNLLLTTVQLLYPGATNTGGSAWATKWGAVGCFVQHVASTNPGFYYGDKYLNNIGAMGEMFQDSYTYVVQPAVEVYQLTANKPQYRNLHQMARIMKAMVFEQITDLYGDIPYFQAGLGYYERIYTPAYDKQQVIYTDLLKEVSQAVDSLSESADKPTGDVLYSLADDQIAQWKKFGNSLLLRMAMRLTKIDPATAQSYVKKVIGNTMQSNDDNAVIQRVVTANAITANQDALQILGNDSTDIRLSSAFISGLKRNNDPRIPVFAYLYNDNGGDNTASKQVGMPSGTIVGGTNPAYNVAIRDSFPKNGIDGYSSINGIILSTSAPNLILTYAETELLLADAYQRWGNIAGDPTSAATHYANGVTAAMEQLSAYGDGGTIDSGDISDYLSAHPYYTGNTTAALSQINYQYWLCAFMDEYEAFANWRRSGDLPALKPTTYPGNFTNGVIPRRLTYPPNQKSTNLANYNAAVADMGGDNMLIRVWWDKQ